ncbi:MAG: hypothetical protein BWX64_02516 [Acidobacteria bacterium ADurb.Bin051]|nr:MAG: hypothetical protein BWX64_02516 [Acidobacteria bacterium ADurb.Bin051]
MTGIAAPAAPLSYGRGASREATPTIMRLTNPTVTACRVAPCQACEKGMPSQCAQSGPAASIASETASQTCAARMKVSGESRGRTTRGRAKTRRFAAASAAVATKRRVAAP